MSKQIYNTEVELGLRCLFILKALYPNYCNLERLLYLDYLSLYIEDFKESTINLHPKYPFQSIEVLDRMQTLQKSITELTFKGLIDVETIEGFSYRGNVNTFWLIENIQSNYSQHLINNIQLIIQETEFMTEKELKNIIYNHIKREEHNLFNDFYPYTEEV